MTRTILMPLTRRTMSRNGSDVKAKPVRSKVLDSFTQKKVEAGLSEKKEE